MAFSNNLLVFDGYSEFIELNPLLSNGYNVEIISGSTRPTRWDFYPSDSVKSYKYNESFDNLSQGYWDLYDVPNKEINLISYLDGDAMVSSFNPNDNYGDGPELWFMDNSYIRFFIEHEFFCFLVIKSVFLT